MTLLPLAGCDFKNSDDDADHCVKAIETDAWLASRSEEHAEDLETFKRYATEYALCQNNEKTKEENENADQLGFTPSHEVENARYFEALFAKVGRR